LRLLDSGAMYFLVFSVLNYFTTYSKIARRGGPEPARGAFRGPIGVPCITPPSRRPSSTEPSAHGSGREKKLRGADCGRRTRTVATSPCRRSRRDMSRRREGRRSRRRADLIEGTLHCADVKRRRRRRAGRRRPRGPGPTFDLRSSRRAVASPRARVEGDAVECGGFCASRRTPRRQCGRLSALLRCASASRRCRSQPVTPSSRQGAANDFQPHLSEQAASNWGQPGRAAAVGHPPLPR